MKYQERSISSYFWHAYTGSEIDYIEERAGKFETFEFKYGKRKIRLPQNFLDSYGKSDFRVINRDNYLDLFYR